MEARLYLITDRVEGVAEAIDGGVGLVQLRHKTLDDSDFVERARALVRICHAKGVRLILNDRVRLVAEAGADGAHVGENDLDPNDARTILGRDKLLGISTHDRDELGRAGALGADYAGLGPMFPTGTKDLARPPRGADLVRETLGATDLPVFVIGGITAANAGQLVTAGARRIAVSAAICGADDPRAAAAELLRVTQV